MEESFLFWADDNLLFILIYQHKNEPEYFAKVTKEWLMENSGRVKKNQLALLISIGQKVCEDIFLALILLIILNLCLVQVFWNGLHCAGTLLKTTSLKI